MSTEHADTLVGQPLLTATQLCRKLQISRSTLWRLQKHNGIRYVKVNGRKRYDATNVERLLKNLNTPTVATTEGK